MFLRSLLLLLLLCSVTARGAVPATVTIRDAPPLFETDGGFVGATIDWWRDNDPVYGPKFGRAGALTVDLDSPGLRAVAASLAPGWLRVGGTPADGIVYEVRGGECANVSTSPEPSCTQAGTSNKCDKCGDAYGCLKWARWVELLQFANATGMRLMFGLNGCRGRHGSATPMDFSNIAALLNRTVSSGLGGLLHGVELGNELIKGYVQPGQMASDFGELRKLLAKLWSAEAHVPIVAGADEIRNMPQFLKAVQPGVLTAATFHMYGTCGHDPGPHMRFPPVSAPGFALQPLCLADGDIPTFTNQVKTNAPSGTRAIIGECALTGGGGANGVTNAFVSSLWYAHWLGSAAKSGVSAVFRETLVGGYYEIVNKTSYEPNPDAFVMALFSRLMGSIVLHADLDISTAAGPANVSQMLRGFAHCSKHSGQLTVLIVNLASETSFTVRIDSKQKVENRIEWHLTAPSGNIHTKQVELNGEVLGLVNGSAMPPMPGKLYDATESIIVEAASVVFVQLPATVLSSSPCANVA